MGIGSLFSRPSDREEHQGATEGTWEDGTSSFPSDETTPVQPVAGPLLTAAHVENVRFHTAKPGYSFAQVEAFVGQVLNTVNRLEAERTEREKALGEAYDEVDHLRDQVQDLTATIEVFRAKGDVLVDTAGNYVTESALETSEVLQAQIAQLTADLAQYAEAYSALEVQRDTLGAEIESLRADLAAASSTPVGNTEERAEHERALAALRAEHAAALDTLRGEHADALSAVQAHGEAALATLRAEHATALEAAAQVEIPQHPQSEDLTDALAAAQAERDEARRDAESMAEALGRALAERDEARQVSSGEPADDRVAGLMESLRRVEAERDEAIAAEAELRTYVETTLAAWQQAAGADTGHAAETTSEPADADEEWGDAPAAAHDALAPVANAPEVPGGVIPAAPAETSTPEVQRGRALLTDAPELRRQS